VTSMIGELTGLIAVVSIFVGIPWMLFHFITRWKQMRSLSGEDENLMDDMNDTARKLEQRVQTIERILDAENPDWRKGN
jgi:phage shock protein B